MNGWTDIGLTIETPMFLAAQPGGTAELRIPALRGAARFWFRALTAPVFGDDFSLVAKAEAEVFGKAAGDGDRVGPSAVAFRLVDPPTEVNKAPKPPWLNVGTGRPRVESGQPRLDNGIGYLLGQGYFHPPDELTQPSHLLPGATGVFSVRARTGNAAYVRQVVGVCLWAIATFGGLGARTRRGFGGISFTGLDALCPETAADAPADRDHPAIARLHELVGGRPLSPSPVPLPDLSAAAEPLPDAPSWSRWYIQQTAVTGSFEHSLNIAGKQLREHRAPVHRPEQSLPFKRWVTREYGNIVNPVRAGHPPVDPTFRIGAFGLPVVFGKKEEVRLADATGGELRRASPLWIRAVRQPNGQFWLVYHVFQARFRPAASTVHIPPRRPEDSSLLLDDTIAYQEIAAFLATALEA